MARDPSQEDVPENPQHTRAQNGCSVLESSHGSVMGVLPQEGNSPKGVQEQKLDWGRW
jgi:hypothetical protein